MSLGAVLARNLTMSLTGQSLVMLLVLLTTPYVITHLGTEAYGVLMLLSTFLQLLSIQQLGFNAGLVKFVAELLDKDDVGEVSRYVDTGLVMYLTAGGLIAVASMLAGPWLIVRMFQIPPHLHVAAVSALYFISGAFPIRFAADVFFSLPMAAQRVHLATAVFVGSEILRILGIVWVLREGFELPAVCAVLLITSGVFLVGTLLCARRTIPNYRPRLRFSRFHAIALIRYSTAIAVFKVNTHVGNVADKLLVAHFFPVGLLGVYEVCYSLAQKLLVVTGNVVSVVFPAASTLAGTQSRHQLREIYVRSAKVVLSLVGLPAIALCLFASELLRHWINAEFAELGSLVLCLLTAAFVVRCLGLIPHVICQATGRPSISARFGIYQGVINLTLLAALVPWLGILGAALALLCSEVAVTPPLLHQAHKIAHVEWRTFAGSCLNPVAAVWALTLSVGVIFRPWAHSWATLALAVGSLLIVYIVLVVWLVVDRTDRQVCRRLFAQTVGSLGR